MNTEEEETKSRQATKGRGERKGGRGMKIEGDITRENTEAVMTEAGKMCGER